MTLSTLDEEMINYISKNLNFIRLAIDTVHHKDDEEIAKWLWQYMKVSHSEIDRQQRHEAIQARRKFNSPNYSKAGH
jgi:hypothetical protein